MQGIKLPKLAHFPSDRDVRTSGSRWKMNLKFEKTERIRNNRHLRRIRRQETKHKNAFA
jgi:hypothetical protein